MTNPIETTSVVANEFNQLAPEYESNRLSIWYKAHSHLIETHCPDTIDGDILDIGCATGYTLRLLADKYPQSRVIGIDIAAEMIAQANKQLNSQTILIADDWENPSRKTLDELKKYNFKLIICANTFHYFNEPQKSINSIFKILDNNGTLLILEREKSKSLLTSFWGLLHHYFIKDQVKFYSATEISQLLDSTGFDNVSIVETIKKYFWNNKLFTSIAIIKGGGTGKS